MLSYSRNAFRLLVLSRGNSSFPTAKGRRSCGRGLCAAGGSGTAVSHPRDGVRGGCWGCFPRQPAVFVSVFCPCLFPVTTALGMTVAWLSPLVPVRGCTITAWLETHTHANTTAPLQLWEGARGSAGGSSPGGEGSRLGRWAGGWQGLQRGKDSAPSPAPAACARRGCLLLPGPNPGTSGVFVGCSLFLP